MEMRQEQLYTYRDYLNWPKDEHWELIEGVAYPTYGPAALAAPTTGHQRLVRKLLIALGVYLEGKSCEVFDSPIDVLFEESESTRTVVQPDVLVVCDPSKIREKNIVGAPDIAVEVTSPSTAPKDWIKKTRLYEARGVREYWIVDANAKAVHRHELKNGAYDTQTFTEGEMPSAVLEGFALNVDALFEQ